MQIYGKYMDFCGFLTAHWHGTRWLRIGILQTTFPLILLSSHAEVSSGWATTTSTCWQRPKTWFCVLSWRTLKESGNMQSLTSSTCPTSSSATVCQSVDTGIKFHLVFVYLNSMWWPKSKVKLFNHWTCVISVELLETPSVSTSTLTTTRSSSLRLIATMTCIPLETAAPTTAPVGGLMPACPPISTGSTTTRGTKESETGSSGERGTTCRRSTTLPTTDRPSKRLRWWYGPKTMLLRRTGKKKRYSHMDRKVEQFELKLTHTCIVLDLHTQA